MGTTGDIEIEGMENHSLRYLAITIRHLTVVASLIFSWPGHAQNEASRLPASPLPVLKTGAKIRQTLPQDSLCVYWREALGTELSEDLQADCTCDFNGVVKGTPPPKGRSVFCTHRTGNREKKDGPFIRWHRNRRAWVLGSWQDGFPTGYWAMFYDNGQLQCAGRFELESDIFGKTGQWVYFYKDGKKLCESNFPIPGMLMTPHFGDAKSVAFFDETGKQVRSCDQLRKSEHQRDCRSILNLSKAFYGKDHIPKEGFCNPWVSP